MQTKPFHLQRSQAAACLAACLMMWAPAVEAPADTSGDGGHWSFQPPRQPTLPVVDRAAWAAHPIDRFVLARLQARGLAPSPPADRHALVRRVYLDLIGLPPTPAQADAFVHDPRPDAYERLVDRLLASPQYGEHWARRWLDLARYADTNGYEKDRPREMWLWRNWVIDALNRDMPFDQFTIEQIAGDLLPNPTVDQRIATGFHRNTMINEEGGVDVEQFRYESVVDRVHTTSTVWLGLTMACAQCHDHKYDPFTQREYFELFAFLNNADEPTMRVPVPEVVAKREAMTQQVAKLVDSLADHFPLPKGDAAAGAGKQQADAGAKTIAARRAAHLRASFDAWANAKRVKARRWRIIEPTRITSPHKNTTFTLQDDGSVYVHGDNPLRNQYTITLPIQASRVTALRLEGLPDERLPNDGPGRSPFSPAGGFMVSNLTVHVGDQRVAIAKATSNTPNKKHAVDKAIDKDIDTGWTNHDQSGRLAQGVFTFKQPVTFGQGGGELVVAIDQHYIHHMTLGRFRLSVTSDQGPIAATGLPAEIEATLAKAPKTLTDDEQGRLLAYYVTVAPQLADVHKQIEKLRKSKPRLPTTLVMVERKPHVRRTTHIHERGEFLKVGQPVAPGVPELLHDWPKGAPRDRLGLARWLVSEANPLVGRVVMNRHWQAFFGQGLVRTPEDLGVQSPPPTHPVLLDWLAMHWVHQADWHLKPMHRLIATSQTYRQSSNVTPELLAKDPENRWLARGPRHRVKAEMIRDMALSASGLLSKEIGGPSVFPPQPDGVTNLAWGGFKWRPSTGADRYRRGLYTYAKRTAPYAGFAVFDGPSGEACVVQRDRSNTPLQALTLLNDAVFLEAARAMAKQVMAETDDASQADHVHGHTAHDASNTEQSEINKNRTPNATQAIAKARLTQLFRRCVTRPPTPAELDQLLAFYTKQVQRFQNNLAGAAQLAGNKDATLAALTAVARVLLNLDEAISKP